MGTVNRTLWEEDAIRRALYFRRKAQEAKQGLDGCLAHLQVVRVQRDMLISEKRRAEDEIERLKEGILQDTEFSLAQECRLVAERDALKAAAREVLDTIWGTETYVPAAVRKALEDLL